MKPTKDLKVDAEWTQDCQGKEDFDGQILGISTRFWPQRYQSNHMFYAKAHIVIYWKSDENSEKYDPGYEDLITKEFEAETAEEVKKAVEIWANEKTREVAEVIKAHFENQR